MELVGMSEIDVNAIRSYNAIHYGNEYMDVKELSETEMKKYLLDRNIGYDFKKKRSVIAKWKGQKLADLYKICIFLKNYGDISLINQNDLPDFDLFNFSFSCFVPGTLIMTDKGYKNIEDIKMGDLVLTHTNKFQKVIKPMVNKTNYIYRLKTMCAEDLLVTEEHPFYVREMKRIKTHVKGISVNYRKFSEPKWVKTKELNKNYYVGVSINQKSEFPNWNGIEVNSTWVKYGNKKQLNNIKNYFSNNDFWWIVGRYIGDGWVQNRIDCKGTDIYNLYICCAKNELNEITDVLDRLNSINSDFKYKYYDNESTYDIRIANVEFAKFLQQFGKYAHGKEITGDILNLPKKQLEAFLDGYMSADGCFTQDIYKAISVSKKIIYGVGQCVAKVYNRPFSIYKNPIRKTHFINGRKISERESYSIHYKLTNNKQDKAFYENGYLWCPINGIEKEDYNGFVYNMEVENDNSYTVNNIIVHNCQDISVAGQQKGMVDKNGEITRSGMYVYGMNIIRVKKPKYIMIENVKNLVSKKFKPEFDSIIQELEENEYNIHWKVINAKDYGIPQSRERVFAICVRQDIDDGSFKFPEPFPLELRLKDVLDIEVDKKYYCSQQMLDYVENKKSKEHNFRVEISDPEGIRETPLRVQGDKPIVQVHILIKVGNVNPSEKGMNGCVYSEEGLASTVTTNKGEGSKILVNEVKGCSLRTRSYIGQPQQLEVRKDNLSNTITSVPKDSMVATKLQEILEPDAELPILHNIYGGFKETEARIFNEYSPTIRTAIGGGHIPSVCTTDERKVEKVVDGYRIRKLTPLECVRLMNFDDEDYYRMKEIGISDSGIYKLCGNSIVVACLYYIFKNLFDN